MHLQERSKSPRCPICGWHKTRPSSTKTLLDALLSRFSLRSFRCRVCRKRFRTKIDREERATTAQIESDGLRS